jgi:3-oxoacyl-[acyl-carrier-protein] synthase-3
MAEASVRAARKALAKSAVAAEEIGLLIYGGVCRDQLEPATACAVADGLGLSGGTQVYDVSNACLGVLNGVLQVAGAIELGQARAGLVVSCESARQIVDVTIDRLLDTPTLENFRLSLATLTGGSGAVAVVVADRSRVQGHALLGGVVRSNARHHDLCRWGPDTGVAAASLQTMRTDSVGVLQHGVALGAETWEEFREFLAERKGGAGGVRGGDLPDRIICHQVGAAHQSTILKSIGLPPERDFTTFEHLGNIGTVSLPLTLAIAIERGFLQPGDCVGLLGIGSGLNCIMLAVDW